MSTSHARHIIETCKAGVLTATLVLSALILPLSPLAPEASAKTFREGNLYYELPTGWKSFRQDNLLVLTPGIEPNQSQALITLTPGLDLNGTDPEAIFTKIVETLDSKNTPENALTNRTPLKKWTTPAGYQAFAQLSIVDQKDGGKLYKEYLATTPGGNRFEMIVYIATTEEALKQYQTGFNTVVSSLEYKNLKDAALQAQQAQYQSTPVRSQRPFQSNPFYTPHFGGADAFNGGSAFNAFK